MYVVKRLHDHCVFKDVPPSEYSNSEPPPLKEPTATAFKAICADDSNALKNCRIDKFKLKNFLSKRYNDRIATKMTYIFDWVNLTEYKPFYFSLDVLILARKKEDNAAPNEVRIDK